MKHLSIAALLLLASAVALLAGCPSSEKTALDAGPDEASDAGTPPATVAFADLCDALAAVTCAGFSSCGCTLEGRPYAPADCAATRSSDCDARFAAFAGQIDEGSVRYDGEIAAACVAGIEGVAARCERIDDASLPRACAGFLIAPAAIGDTCVGVGPLTTCADGAGWCAPPSLACVAIPEAGEPCIGGYCADGLRCIQSDTDFTCAARGEAGDDCIPEPGACVEGLVCIDLKCRAPLGEDEGLCQSAIDCGGGFACVGGSCIPAPERGYACAGPTCGDGDACVRAFAERSCRERVAEGEPCVSDSQCMSGYCATAEGRCAALPALDAPCPEARCAAGLLCDFDAGGVCVLGPGAGEPCLIGPAGCADGLGCNTDNLCAAPGPEGSECLIPTNLCGPELACDFTADGSFCVPRRGEGGHCESNVCAEDLYCDFSSLECSPTLAVGEACPSGGGCASSDECGDLLGGSRCTDVPNTVGAPCYERCDGDLACAGAGGVCAASICASP